MSTRLAAAADRQNVLACPRLVPHTLLANVAVTVVSRYDCDIRHIASSGAAGGAAATAANISLLIANAAEHQAAHFLAARCNHLEATRVADSVFVFRVAHS